MILSAYPNVSSEKLQNIFAKSKCDLGVTYIKHIKINIGDAVPRKEAARRLPSSKDK